MTTKPNTPTECRGAWRSFAHDKTETGPWFPIEMKAALEKLVAVANKACAGQIAHWIETR